jgi:hypothetical protein
VKIETGNWNIATLVDQLFAYAALFLIKIQLSFLRELEHFRISWLLLRLQKRIQMALVADGSDRAMAGMHDGVIGQVHQFCAQ